MDSSHMLEANKIWSMLDDMARNDPSGYKKFIEKQMEEGRKLMKPPEIYYVVKVINMQGTPSWSALYLCTWSRMTKAESDDAPLPMLSGDVVPVTSGERKDEGITRAFYVVVNEAICENCGDNGKEPKQLQPLQQDYLDALIQLSIRFLNETKQAHLCLSNYCVQKWPVQQEEMYKSLHFDPNFNAFDPNAMFGSVTQAKTTSSSSMQQQTTPATSITDMLKQIKLAHQEADEPVTKPLATAPAVAAQKVGKPLVEEICSEQAPVTFQVSDQSPEASIRIPLTGVHSVKDLALDISDTELLVELIKEPEKTVSFKFPQKILSSTAKAKFNRKEKCLVIQASLLSSHSS